MRTCNLSKKFLTFPKSLIFHSFLWLEGRKSNILASQQHFGHATLKKSRWFCNLPRANQFSSRRKMLKRKQRLDSLSEYCTIGSLWSIRKVRNSIVFRFFMQQRWRQLATMLRLANAEKNLIKTRKGSRTTHFSDIFISPTWSRFSLLLHTSSPYVVSAKITSSVLTFCKVKVT